MRRLLAAAVMAASLGALEIRLPTGHVHAHEGHARAHQDRGRLAALHQTLLRVEPAAPLQELSLTGPDGTSIGPGILHGRWSLVFFGFTSCGQVCPLTLQVLGQVARHPASGVGAATTQIVFVSVDPFDTPLRVRSFLGHFDPRIIGLSGSTGAVERFSREIGAAYRRTGATIDHSTSIFVTDSLGRLAGVLLRPADPVQIVADLATLRARPAGSSNAARIR